MATHLLDSPPGAPLALDRQSLASARATLNSSCGVEEEPHTARHLAILLMERLRTTNKRKLPSWLLFDSLTTLAKLWLPLHYIIFRNSQRFRFFMYCEKYDRRYVQFVCQISGACVWACPYIGSFLAIYLVAWRMARKRTFYVLLEHDVYVSFTKIPWYSRSVLKLLAFFFGCALFHFIFHYFNKVDFLEFISNPMVALKEEHEAIATTMQMTLYSYITPFCVYILFIRDCYNFEVNLLSLSTYVMCHNRQTCATLERMWLVRESVIASLVHEQLLTPSGRKSYSENNLQELFSQLTFGSGSVPLREAPRLWDFDRKVAPTTGMPCTWTKYDPRAAIKKWLFMRWWPCQLIVDIDDENDCDSFHFKYTWLCYLFVTLTTVFLQLWWIILDVFDPMDLRYSSWAKGLLKSWNPFEASVYLFAIVLHLAGIIGLSANMVWALQSCWRDRFRRVRPRTDSRAESSGATGSSYSPQGASRSSEIELMSVS